MHVMGSVRSALSPQPPTPRPWNDVSCDERLGAATSPDGTARRMNRAARIVTLQPRAVPLGAIGPGAIHRHAASCTPLSWVLTTLIVMPIIKLTSHER